MNSEDTRALIIYAAVKALRSTNGFHVPTARDEITRTIRRIHKSWPTRLTNRLKHRLNEIGVPYKDTMTTHEIYILNRKLKSLGINRIIHVEHINGGVKSISNKIISTDIDSPNHVASIIKDMSFIVARLLEEESHLCEKTTIESFEEWDNSQ